MTQACLPCRLHQLTKHRVFTGPGFQVAAELGEAANGGQVLLSHNAWLRLQGRMHEASFPVVEQLGSYKLNAWPVPLPVYQASLLPCFHAEYLEVIIQSR